VSDTLYKYKPNTGLIWKVKTHRGVREVKKRQIFLCFRRLLEPFGAHFGLLVGPKRSYSIMSYINHLG